MSAGKITDVGVIGLGIIGSRVAACLRRKNFNVFVWNRTARPAPAFVASPHEIAELSQVIQIFVRDAEALLEVMKDMKPALKKHHVVCCHSTVSAESVKKAAALAAEMGAGFLDAPFTGSKMAAEKGELVYYIGGQERELEKARPVLEASSKKILSFGPNVGDATVLKIATNLVSGAIVGALAEALAITKEHGVEPARLLEAFEGNANCSPLITMKLPAMMTSSYEPHFSLKNMLKDARYAQELARAKAVATPVLDAAAGLMERSAELGNGDRDYSVVYENLAALGPASAESRIRIKIGKESARNTLRASAFDAATDQPAPVAMTPEQFRQVERDGAVVDLSARAKWRVTGGDRVRYLNGQVTNDVRRAKEDEALYACVTNAKGRIDGDVCIHAAPGSALSLDAEPGLRDLLSARLEKYVVADDVAIEDVTGDWKLFHLFGAACDRLAPASALSSESQGRIVRNNRMGVAGFDIWLGAAEPAPAFPVPELRRRTRKSGASATGFRAGPTS